MIRTRRNKRNCTLQIVPLSCDVLSSKLNLEINDMHASDSDTSEFRRSVTVHLFSPTALSKPGFENRPLYERRKVYHTQLVRKRQTKYPEITVHDSNSGGNRETVITCAYNFSSVLCTLQEIVSGPELSCSKPVDASAERDVLATHSGFFLLN